MAVAFQTACGTCPPCGGEPPPCNCQPNVGTRIWSAVGGRITTHGFPAFRAGAQELGYREAIPSRLEAIYRASDPPVPQIVDHYNTSYPQIPYGTIVDIGAFDALGAWIPDYKRQAIADTNAGVDPTTSPLFSTLVSGSGTLAYDPARRAWFKCAWERGEWLDGLGVCTAAGDYRTATLPTWEASTSIGGLYMPFDATALPAALPNGLQQWPLRYMTMRERVSVVYGAGTHTQEGIFERTLKVTAARRVFVDAVTIDQNLIGADHPSPGLDVAHLAYPWQPETPWAWNVAGDTALARSRNWFSDGGFLRVNQTIRLEDPLFEADWEAAMAAAMDSLDITAATYQEADYWADGTIRVATPSITSTLHLLSSQAVAGRWEFIFSREVQTLARRCRDIANIVGNAVECGNTGTQCTTGGRAGVIKTKTSSHYFCDLTTAGTTVAYTHSHAGVSEFNFQPQLWVSKTARLGQVQILAIDSACCPS